MYKIKQLIILVIILISLPLRLGWRKIFCVIIVLLLPTLYFLANQHLTILLIQLEALGLRGLALLIIRSQSIEKDLVPIFTIIVVSVVEAALGLSLVVKQARYHHTELLKFKL